MSSGHWLRILLYQDLPGVWVARSLEHDIAVEGSTIEAASAWVLRIILAHIEFDQRHGRAPLSTFPEAPQRYWNAFLGATSLRTVSCGKDGNVTNPERLVLIAVTSERPAATSSGRTPRAHAHSLPDASIPISNTFLRVN